MPQSVLFWRRTDVEGFERLELTVEPDKVTATSTVLCLSGGFEADLVVDDDGLVLHYEHLFERVTPAT